MPVGAGFIPARIGENKKMTEHKKLQPEIRFAGFTDDWEQCKLGDVVNIIMGQSPDSKNYTNNSSDHILVQGNADIKNGFVYPRVWTTQITKQSHSGDLIMSVRAPVGDIAKTEYDVVLGRGVCAIKGNEFIFQLLTKMKENDYWESLSTGSTFDSINSNDIKNAEIFIPSLEEQTQIGNFFKQLDDTIALHQGTLEKYQKLKVSYLEKMFPKENELYPELRFPNFTDAWEQRKLGDICNITTGKLDANAMVENGKYDFFTSGIKKYKIDHYAFLGPALTIAGNGTTVGYMHYADGFFNAYQRTYVLTELLGDRTFLFSTINRKLQKKIQQEARAGNIPYIVLDMLTELDIYLPSLEEQTQIGNFFKQLDDTIALHQKELAKYQQIKTACLEKMFVE